jgi:dethiobiotin synthetase
MSKRIFITATNTDIGKSYTTQKLLESFTLKGYRVGVIKPIETGVIDGNAPDGLLLLEQMQKYNTSLKDFTLKDVVPIQYELAAAPYIASNNTSLDIKKLDNALAKLEEFCDVVLIEGAGGLLVPIDDDMMMVDLISYFDATALLVTHCSLGCINDTLLSIKLLEDKNIKYFYAFNCREEDSDFEKISEPYFLKSGKKVLKVSNDIDTLCELLYNC